MKDFMIDLMVNMMPFMKPFLWFGVVVAAIGLLFVLAQVLLKSDNQAIIVWTARIVFTVAIFFVNMLVKSLRTNRRSIYEYIEQ